MLCVFIVVPDPWADPKHRSTLGFHNLHHESIRVQNSGFYFLDPPMALCWCTASLKGSCNKAHFPTTLGTWTPLGAIAFSADAELLEPGGHALFCGVTPRFHALRTWLPSRRLSWEATAICLGEIGSLERGLGFCLWLI